MTSEIYLWALALAGAIICVLLIKYIARQLRTGDKQPPINPQKTTEQRQSIIDSIRIIALCMLEDQVELSEGCIRIKVLLDQIEPDLHNDEKFLIFNLMYEATKHMPTHKARKQTDKRFIYKLDKQRFALEREHKEAILAASKAIRNHRF